MWSYIDIQENKLRKILGRMISKKLKQVLEERKVDQKEEIKGGCNAKLKKATSSLSYQRHIKS